MKRYYNGLLTLMLIGLVSSCSLDEEVYSAFDTNNFYQTRGDADLAITAAYAPIGDMYYLVAGLMASDLSADQTYPRPVVGRDTYTLFNYDPNYTTQKSFSRLSESPQQIWQSCYSGIEKTNWVIERIPSANIEESYRNQVAGEAYFLRAFYHWMLTKNFGDVIIKVKASNVLDNAINPISPKDVVYKQILLDLDQAAAWLPDYSASHVKGRAHKQAAQALHAKAALYAEEWSVALQKAQEVIQSGKHTLMPNVRDAFNVAMEDDARKENIWAFEGDNLEVGRWSFVMGLYGPRNSSGPAYARSSFGSIFAYPAFFASFDPKDERRQLLDTTYIDIAGKTVRQKDITPITPKGVLVKKYQDPNSIGDRNNVNIPILRYADVLLIAAEAEARLNGPTSLAYGYVNEVRRRAKLDDLQEGLSKEDFISAVLQERSWELFAEGDRWYDLTRTNTFMSVIPAATNDVYPVRSVQPKNRYFPIPQDEINANPLIEQNPDWR